MAGIFDVQAQKLAKEVAAALMEKKEMQPPKWAAFVKTGSHRERAPADRNWWHIRAASILRTIYKNMPIGVSKLRSRYGGKRNRGVKSPKFTKASGAIIRKILQQLESASLVKQKKDGVHKGRIITPAGVSLLEKAAKSIGKRNGHPINQAPEI